MGNWKPREGWEGERKALKRELDDRRVISIEIRMRTTERQR